MLDEVAKLSATAASGSPSPPPPSGPTSQAAPSAASPASIPDDKAIGLASRDEFTRASLEAVEVPAGFRTHVTGSYLLCTGWLARSRLALSHTSDCSALRGVASAVLEYRDRVAATGATAAETSAMQQSAQAAYIARLQQQGTCKTDEVARKFFIVSAELCIERHLAGVLARKVPITNDTSNAQYHVVDAFARLVTLLTKHYFTDATAKVRSRQAAQCATVLELRPAAALQLTLPRPRRHRRSPHVDRCHCLPMRSTRSFACWCTMPKRGRATSINDPTIASLRCG